MVRENLAVRELLVELLPSQFFSPEPGINGELINGELINGELINGELIGNGRCEN
jgi:hypothetical protein